MLGFILLGISHIDIGANGLHIKRRKILRCTLESRTVVVVVIIVIAANKRLPFKHDALKGAVVNLDFSRMKVCGIEIMFSVEFANRAALVDRILAGAGNKFSCGTT